MFKVLVINGPNLNMLGSREKNIYGSSSLEEIQKRTQEILSKYVSKFEIEWFQSNIEGEIIDKIQKCSSDKSLSGLVINPAAYTHTSVGIHDALKLVKIPVCEVHLSNTFQREDFRKERITSQSVNFAMEGLGENAYINGVLALWINREQ